jgi:hypothetical protein
VIAVVLMRGEVLRGVSALRGNGRPSGRRGETQRTPGSAAGGNVCSPRAEEIRRGGEKPRGRSVIRCMAASDRRRGSSDGEAPGIVEARGSAHRGGGSSRSVGASRQVGGVVDGGVVTVRTPRGVNGRKPQERKVSTAFARSTDPGTKRGLWRGARGEEGRCQRATARRYVDGGAKAEDLEDPSDRVGEPTPASPARSRRERGKANEPATKSLRG